MHAEFNCCVQGGAAPDRFCVPLWPTKDSPMPGFSQCSHLCWQRSSGRWLPFTSLLLVCCLTGSLLWGDGPQDNHVDNVRPVPPPGIELTAEQHQQLEERLALLTAAIDELRTEQHQATHALLPDVEVLHRAVEQALTHQELYAPNDFTAAGGLLNLGLHRAAQLKEGKADWTRQHGLVIRGFRSALDDTVQPYGLEIAPDYNFDAPHPARCDIWFHGRGEKSLEVQFLAQRSRTAGQYPPTTGIVLHPFGRYSNAFKFAGEVDVLEALAHVQQHYRIDENRISVRGFSMGGAACWQFAVHYPDRWFAANPGAGFSETPEFLKSFQGETLNPPWYEEKLWRMYDCNLWAGNLRTLPTVAYSGELDRQKQAADVIEAALRRERIELVHIIGPETAHRIHPDSNRIIREKLDQLAIPGRARTPRRVDFTTFTLKYNRQHWVQVDGLEEHWERSHVRASYDDNDIRVATSGVTALTLDFPTGTSPFIAPRGVRVTIDGQQLPAAIPIKSDRSLTAVFHRVGQNWKAGPAPVDSPTRKQSGLQGPIDDAFMGPFLFVRPTGEFELPELSAWVDQELERAIREWRRQMRGDVRIKLDTEVTEEDLQRFHLILWGTPSTNSLLYKLADKLPISWGDTAIQAGSEEYNSGHHVLAMIHPNPLNPAKYLVLNSGFTYREYDYLNNARQTPKLPDWAIIDIRTPPNARWPGKIVAADFFDEQWQLKTRKPSDP